MFRGTPTRSVACFARLETCCNLEYGGDDDGDGDDGGDAVGCDCEDPSLKSVAESSRKSRRVDAP